MAQRHPKGLAAIDPLAAPLPHGTEVTTRVERQLGDRRIPQGVVGRVVAIREDGFSGGAPSRGERRPLWSPLSSLVTPRVPPRMLLWV